jgi:hypothetical protein
MRIRHSSALATFGLLLAAGSAAAAPIAVSASLRIELGYLGAVVATDTGVIDVSGGVYTIPAGLVSLASATVPVTATTAVGSLVALGIANLAGTFAPGGVTSQAPGEVCLAPMSAQACVSGGGLGGVMALTGVIAIHVIPHIAVIPVSVNAVNVGEGGSASQPFTIDGAPWTTGTVKIDQSAAPDVTTMGSVGTGSLALVSGSYVLVCGNLLPITARLTLTGLVPEPAGLALIAIGVAGLIGLARKPR